MLTTHIIFRTGACVLESEAPGAYITFTLPFTMSHLPLLRYAT